MAIRWLSCPSSKLSNTHLPNPYQLEYFSNNQSTKANKKMSIHVKWIELEKIWIIIYKIDWASIDKHG